MSVTYLIEKIAFKSQCTQYLQALFPIPRCTAEKFPNFQIIASIIFGEIKSNVFNLDLCGHKTGVFNRSKIM